ncbi:MAG: putative rRNA methylase [Acidimicrobiales bacterium]|nr:putative rRNA methylase [Acidimicrobiales bacterium]
MRRVPVDDPDDPRLAEFVGLRDHELRQRRESPGGDLAGVFIAEGDLVVERAVRAGYRLRAVLVDATRSEPLSIDPGATPVYAAGPDVVRRITGMGVHRGIMASLDRRPVPDAVEVVAVARRVVVLEDVNNPTNLGLIARSAAALGVDALLLDPTCCDPLYRRAARVSMGEVYALPYARTDRLPEGLAVLRDRGFEIVALTPDPDAEPIEALAPAPEDRVALLFGAEGPGLRTDTLAAADRRVQIPLHGEVDSLNVGVAAAIACYVLGRTRD